MEDIDPIEELHQIRKKLYAEAGGTPAAFARFLRASQGEDGRKVVSFACSSKKPAKHQNITEDQHSTVDSV